MKIYPRGYVCTEVIFISVYYRIDRCLCSVSFEQRLLINNYHCVVSCIDFKRLKNIIFIVFFSICIKKYLQIMFLKIICSYRNKVFILLYIYINIRIFVIFKYGYLKEYYIHINLFSILINNFILIFKFILNFLFIKKINNFIFFILIK